MRRRSVDKHFRFTPEENRKLKDLSIKSRLSENNVICSLIEGVNIREAPSKELFEYLRKIDKIGVNINQLTHIANATGNIYIHELQRQFKEINDLTDDIRKKFII